MEQPLEDAAPELGHSSCVSLGLLELWATPPDTAPMIFSGTAMF